MEDLLDARARDLYSRLMGEVKCRLDDIHRMGTTDAGFCPMTSIEFAAIQFRQVFETIAWACMVANGQPLTPELLQRRKERNPRFLFKYLEGGVMPDCYPTPLVRVPEGRPKVRVRGVARLLLRRDKRFRGELGLLAEEEWLTRSELIRLHGELSKLLHIRNPLRGESLNSEYYTQMIPLWWQKTVNLVTLHRIALPGDNMCIVEILKDGQILIDDFYVVGSLDTDRDLIVSRSQTKRFS